MELGMGEIVVILVVALLFFGPSKLPQLGEALGRGIRNFKNATAGEDETPPTESSRGAPSGATNARADADEHRADASPHSR